MPDLMLHHPAAVRSVLDLVRRATSDETTRVVEALLRAIGDTAARTVEVAKLADAIDGGDLEATRARVDEANREFRVVFGICLFGPDRAVGGAVDEYGSDSDQSDQRLLWLALAFVDVLEQPAPICPAGPAPDPDEATESWIAVAAACARSGVGHHLALRCSQPGPRELLDVARLAAVHTDVRIVGPSGDGLELAVLRAELHAGANPVLVVIDREIVSAAVIEDDDEDEWDRPKTAKGVHARQSLGDAHRFNVLRGLRNTYLWRAPAALVADANLTRFLGGIFGPFASARQWRDAELARLLPGIGSVGAAALSARVADARDAGPIAAVTRVAASTLGLEVDEAAVFVAGSLSGVCSPKRAVPAGFDARLVVSDEQGLLLLARAPELARHGGRVLFWGPPGGGKSTFAQALAAAMGRSSQMLTAAAILARHWGVTERLIADIWSRAADDGSTIIIDELDSLCGVRDPNPRSASGGNNYLVRTLTNEFLRAFDMHDVPVLATANHLETIDEAVRRRFTFVVHVPGELRPHAERLAWRVMFEIDPPPDWEPIGASVSDFANAGRRCRMLGMLDPDSLAEAIQRSRDARLGPRTTRAKRSLQ